VPKKLACCIRREQYQQQQQQQNKIPKHNKTISSVAQRTETQRKRIIEKTAPK